MKEGLAEGSEVLLYFNGDEIEVRFQESKKADKINSLVTTDSDVTKIVYTVRNGQSTCSTQRSKAVDILNRWSNDQQENTTQISYEGTPATIFE